MTEQYRVITNPIVNVCVSTESNNFKSERRLQRDISIQSLKSKLELVTGTVSSHMILELYSEDDKYVCVMDQDESMLGSYPVEDLYRIHVKTKTGVMPTVNYEDTSQVKKYEISENDYSKRTDSVRAFKERAKLGKFKDVDEKEVEDELKKKKEIQRLEIEALQKVTIGDRCEVTLPNQPSKRGEVMYKGETDFQAGQWVGVKYDEPLGKNDGSVKGKRYFQCEAKYGGFVKSTQLKCGDYPEIDLLEDEDFEM